MKQIQFSNYAAQQQNVLGSLNEVITEGAKQGWDMLRDKKSKNVINISKAGNPQLIFVDKEDARVYIRISTNLDAALTAGEKISILESPVYEVALEQLDRPAGTPAPKMLVVGMKAEAADLERVKLEDIAKLFGSYAKAEPAGK